MIKLLINGYPLLTSDVLKCKRAQKHACIKNYQNFVVKIWWKSSTFHEAPGNIEWKGNTCWYIGNVSAYGITFILRECTWQFSRKGTR